MENIHDVIYPGRYCVRTYADNTAAEPVQVALQAFAVLSENINRILGSPAPALLSQ